MSEVRSIRAREQKSCHGRCRLTRRAVLAAKKTGAFRDWKEDDEVSEIFLPLPAGTSKKELVCIITPDKLNIRHVRLGQTLLHVDPLAGPVNPEESTWYLQGELLVIVLAKVACASTEPLGV